MFLATLLFFIFLFFFLFIYLFIYFFLVTKHSLQYGFGFCISSKMSLTSAGLKNWRHASTNVAIDHSLFFYMMDLTHTKQLLNLFCIVISFFFFFSISFQLSINLSWWLPFSFTSQIMNDLQHNFHCRKKFKSAFLSEEKGSTRMSNLKVLF